VAEYYEDDLKNSRKRTYETAVSPNGF